MSARILLVEDDPDLARGLAFNLGHEGFTLECAPTARRARELMAAGGFDLVLLDLSLPDGDGTELLAAWRREGRTTPVICLTARAAETDIVMGLKTGADDYLTKPFGLAELLARIAAVLRRARPAQDGNEVIRVGAAAVDLAARRVVRGRVSEPLTPIETEIVRFLAARRGQAVDRQDMLKALWGVDNRATTRTLDNHVARLRRKVEADPAEPQWITTVHGVGYRLEAETGR